MTKLLIMPSLWNESFGLVAAEAMSNGIPVLASDRGSLPEVVAEGGLLFNIPDRYTPETTDVPSADEVEPWVDAVVRLWDDTGFYRRQSQIAAMHAQQWHPDRLRAVYVEFFRNLQPQPGPPIVPPPHTSAGGQSERPHRSDRLEVIQVEPTTRCNFHCRFCAGRHLPQKDMTLDTFAHVLRSSHAVRHIRLQGEGEPLLCPGFFEMIEMAKSHHPEVRVSTITNGSLLSANANRLVQSGLQHVSVSIDSADPELFEELRGGRSRPGSRRDQGVAGGKGVAQSRSARHRVCRHGTPPDPQPTARNRSPVRETRPGWRGRRSDAAGYAGLYAILRRTDGKTVPRCGRYCGNEPCHRAGYKNHGGSPPPGERGQFLPRLLCRLDPRVADLPLVGEGALCSGGWHGGRLLLSERYGP